VTCSNEGLKAWNGKLGCSTEDKLHSFPLGSEITIRRSSGAS
jgi:hypothetical protein